MVMSQGVVFELPDMLTGLVCVLNNITVCRGGLGLRKCSSRISVRVWFDARGSLIQYEI